ncbi:MAG: hypothetical protein R3B84_12595 [Zavarzinella sp.]
MILLLPITTICYGIARTDFPKSTRRWLGILLALSFFFIMSTSTGVWPESEDITKQIGKLTQAYGAYTWAFFCQLGAIVIMLRTNVAKLNV